MKYLFSIAAGLSLFFLNFSGCEKKNNTDALCNQITLNKPFNAKINELWCLDQVDWSIRFGPFVEDSRCNVANIECIWAGRYVMEATITNGGQQTKDTFYAVNNWSDTLYQDNYKIILTKVYPEMRQTMDPLDPSKYAFDITVQQE